VLVVLSPKAQLQVYGLVPPEADPVKVTARGAVPDVGLAEADAVSAAAALTVIVTDLDAVFDFESVTVSVAVYVPAVEYVCEGL
jgi:hypothetical protein